MLRVFGATGQDAIIGRDTLRPSTLPVSLRPRRNESMPACRRAAQQRDEFASSHVRPQVERPNLPHCRCEECLVRRADQCPLCEVERTLCGRRATSESDPQPSSATTKYLRESVIDMNQMRAAVFDIQ